MKSRIDSTGLKSWCKKFLLTSGERDLYVEVSFIESSLADVEMLDSL